MSCEKTMKFDIEEFRQRRKTDFEGAWHAGPSVITPPASAGIYPRYTYRRAKVHPIFDTIARLRAAYLSMGFDEAMVPVFIDEPASSARKQQPSSTESTTLAVSRARTSASPVNASMQSPPSPAAPWTKQPAKSS